MKKKKINKNENEWKGVLQEKEPFTIRENCNIPDRFKKELGEDTYFYQVGESNVTPDIFTVTNTNVNNEIVGEINLKEYKLKIESNVKLGYDEEDIKRIKILEWDNFAKNKTLNGEKEHCNVGVNKDWSDEKWVETLNKLCDEQENQFNVYKSKPAVKEKRIEFEFTPFTFWQLTPSVAINLNMKEVEFVWLCFGAYINWK